MRPSLPSTALALAGIGASWCLIRQIKRTYQRIGPAPDWHTDNEVPSREYWIDETIEASFPASDPSAATPVSGPGR